MKNIIKRFLTENKGVTAIEYGLIAGIIAVGIVTATTGVKTAIVSTFNAVASALPTGTSGGGGG
ncbi:Flp family type IVb pilin [Paraburkholderia hayleyella]|uniref:Flp family type IVb pilin n=1 Tax=Paraburkholderia hayleyella TaxID=2152889 RepID=UPI0012913FA4|nr:Flp family type IVb pilin [Paraburkholderia hayleyella]